MPGIDFERPDFRGADVDFGVDAAGLDAGPGVAFGPIPGAAPPGAALLGASFHFILNCSRNQ